MLPSDQVDRQGMSSNQKLTFVTREEWEGCPPKWQRFRKNPAKYVFIGYTKHSKCKYRQKCLEVVLKQQQRHMRDSKCPDIRYSFLIGGDHAVYEGRGWNTVPGLPADYASFNHDSTYIAIIGPYTVEYPPGKDLTQVCDSLIQYGLENKYIEEGFTKQII